MSQTYTVAEAAKLIASPHDDLAHTANQLRRFVQRGAVQTRGVSGSGRTASNLFSLTDLAVARVQRTLIALGVASDAIQQEVAVACYFDGEAMRNVVEEAQRRADHGYPQQNVVFRLDMTEPDENGTRQMKGTLLDGDEAEAPYAFHPALALSLMVPLKEWLSRVTKAG